MKRFFAGLVTSPTALTVLTSAITAIVTSLIALGTGWISLPLDKKRLEISAEIDTKLKEKEKQLETKLEVTKAELTQKFMKPRLVTEGLTQTQMQEERRLRELIAAVSAQFETALASENTRSLKGKTESQGLYQLLLNSHLPQEAIAGAKAFNSHVQNFLRSYSAKDSPKADAPEVTAALAQEKELRMKAVSDLDKWLDVQTVPRPTPVQD